MTRKKVKLALIAEDSARKTSYKKRKKGLLKKMEELTTICGIEACAIIYSDFDVELPELWPSPWGVQRVLFKFNRYSQLDQSKKMLSQETYMMQRVNKAKENLKRVWKDNREKEISLLMYQYLTEGKILDNLSMVDLNDLTWMINEKQNEINCRLSALNINSGSTSEAQSNQEVNGEKHEDAAKADGEVTKQGQDHGKRLLEMSMDASSQNIPWYLNMINGGEGENQLLPFGEFNSLHK